MRHMTMIFLISAGAMKAMVSKDIVHRDLKPQNILLSHDGKTKNPQPADIRLKIADFGFARHLQTTSLADTLCGSPLYMAPEIIERRNYDHRVDTWAIGVMTYICLTGTPPFYDEKSEKLKDRICNDEVNFSPS